MIRNNNFSKNEYNLAEARRTKKKLIGKKTARMISNRRKSNSKTTHSKNPKRAKKGSKNPSKQHPEHIEDILAPTSRKTAKLTDLCPEERQKIGQVPNLLIP